MQTISIMEQLKMMYGPFLRILQTVHNNFIKSAEAFDSPRMTVTSINTLYLKSIGGWVIKLIDLLQF